jgi:hypothetical protein
MHVYDFITDQEQNILKANSRIFDKEQPFEHVLVAYSQLFMQQLNTLTVDVDSKYLTGNLKTNPGLKHWFEGFCDLIKRDKLRIQRLFEDLINVYEVFISGKHQTAVSLFSYFLEKYDLLDTAYDELLGCFFRARWIQEGEDYSKEEYYYHIPFNKRFLIKNQRFSFSGIPILYAGESLAATFFELGAPNLEEKGIAVASFNYDHLAHVHFNSDFENIKNRNNIYDITNTIYEVINDMFFAAIEKGIKIGVSMYDQVAFPPNVIVRSFRKFILSQVCTFPRKQHIENQHFIEEYVLPQLLTEAIRNHKYDGILYPSTRFNKPVDIGTGWHSKLFQANLAMFTNYSHSSFYDEELLKNLLPHVLNLKNISQLNVEEEINKLKSDTVFLQDFFHKYVAISSTRRRFEIRFIHLEKKIKTYEVLSIDNLRYLDTYAGKVELSYIREYLNYIFRTIRMVYEHEYSKMIEDQERTKTTETPT